ARAGEQGRLDGAEVDQVARVGEQRPHRSPCVGGAERRHLLVPHLPPLPLAAVLDEDLRRRAAELGRPLHRRRQPPRHRDVGAEGGERWQLPGHAGILASGFGRLRPMLSRLLRGLGCLAYALLVVVVFGLAAYTSFSLFVRSGVTTVPSVVGLSRGDAANVLADQGLTLQSGELAGRYDDKVPAGRIARQTPDPRTLMKRGRPVRVVISRGPRRVTVPDLRGKTLPAAQAAISGTGLALGHILGTLAPNHEAPGSVIEQDPDPNAAVPPATGVDLLLAMAAPGARYVMPDLVYRNYDQ